MSNLGPLLSSCFIQVLAGRHRTTLQCLENLQKQVVDDELIKWKKQQQLHGNGASFDASMIDTLQRW